MATGKQKLTRKQLLREPDEFITFTGKLIRFAREHERAVYIVCIGALSLVILVAALQYYFSSQEKKAYALYEKAQLRYSLGQSTGETEQGLEAVSTDLSTVIKDYGGTPAGKLAAVSLARVAMDRGQYDEAIVSYERALKDYSSRPLVDSMVRHGLGYAFESKKDFARAAEEYEKVARNKAGSFREDALLALGRVYGLLGQKEKSRKAYETFIKDYPESRFTSLAEERLAGLDG